MLYVALTACFGWVATTCLFAYLLLKVLERQNEERAAHRIEVDVQRQENAQASRSHREEIAALNQARIEEVANLLQRIQAPEYATAEHAGRNATPDPPPLDYEDDVGLLAEAQARMDEFASDLEAMH